VFLPKLKSIEISALSHSALSWVAADPDSGTWAELLSISPTIIHSFPLPGVPLGAASTLGPALKHQLTHFLIMSAWTLEQWGQSTQLAHIAKSYLNDHPKHRVTFLGNTERETELLLEEGCKAVTINHNCLSNEELFKPLPEIEPVYDAVYNARFSRWKRHELASDIEKLALVYFRHVGEQSIEEFSAEHARLVAMMPNARFMNELTPEGCDWIPANYVNRILAQSRVGLCLSEAEGAMRASIEYLLAGLSVVSTPNFGGRNFFFDDEFCIICDPDPRSVREAVDALVARNVSREYVRTKTLTKVGKQRRVYIDLVQGIIDRAGGTLQFEDRFWELTQGEGIMRWGSMKQFGDTVSRLVRDAPAQFSSAWAAQYAEGK
jgi:glycosyltransferase involved in cell wall biosynthesis